MNILHINSNFLYTTLFEKMIDSINLGRHEVFSPISGVIKFTVEPKDYVHYPVTFNKYDRFRFKYKQKKIMTEFNNNYNAENYNIIHAHTLFTDGNIAFELNKKYNIPYVVAVRNTDVNMFFKYRINLRKLGVEILKHSERIVFLSQAYLDIVLEKYIPDHLKELIVKKSVIIPNGIDDFWHDNKNSKTNIVVPNSKTLNIIYAGKINKNKNLLTALKAIKILRDSGIDVTFNVAGEIQDQAIFQKIASTTFVNYKGVLKKEQLINLYRENNIFLMPSYHETFGLVYAEAMSQGLPVIYTKGQGFDKQFSEGTVGYHVNPNNPRDIANKIRLIHSNLNNFTESSLNAVEVFKWERIAGEYEVIYREISENETI